MTLRINIGAGNRYIPGMVNIDIADRAEVSLDLNVSPLPFDDDSVDLAFSYHTLEHIDRYVFALGEIHRVLKHGAPLLLGVPYVSLTYWHQVNPYHLHSFNEDSFDFFDPSRLRRSAAEDTVGVDIRFKKVFHRFHYMGMFHLVPPPLRGWARVHLLNTVRKIDFGLLAVKRSDPVDADPRALRAEFDLLLASRIPYGRATADPPRRSSRPHLSDLRAWWQGNR
jgi:predicted SAM-dependent methyltransferase